MATLPTNEQYEKCKQCRHHVEDDERSFCKKEGKIYGNDCAKQDNISFESK